MIQLNAVFSTVVLLVIVSMPANGDQTEVSDFERRAKELGATISSDDSHESVRCRELRKEMEKQRQKGQRGIGAKNAYNLECQALYDTPVDPPSPIK